MHYHAKPDLVKGLVVKNKAGRVASIIMNRWKRW